MKVRHVVLLSAGILLFDAFVSCNGFGKRKATEVTMNRTDLYNRNAVSGFLKQHPEKNAASDAAFSKAVDAYRNKKDIATAYDLLAESIALHPTARAYYELGNVCMERLQYGEATDAYKMAEQLGYEPVSKLFYNIACAYALQHKEEKATAYLQYAIYAGYSNTKHIMGDSDLNNIRQSYAFQASYQDAMSGASDAEITLWQSFKREFKTLAFPLALDMKTVIDAPKYINFEFEKFVSEMRTEKFSREVGKEFYYYTLVEDNANYTALIYAIKNSIMSDGAPCRYVLISFDPKGILIDKKSVGGQLELNEPYLACTLQQNLNFEIKTFKNTYEKDPEQDGYENNPIAKTELTGTEHYKINEAGKFVLLTPELSMK